MNRREFIKTVALVSAYATLWRRPVLARMANPRSAIVIGAGMSGLAAARALRAGGTTVTVLEGRERIGGRVWTDRSLGAPVDLGASWIHGVDGNPITELAGEGKIATKPTDYDNILMFDHDGTPIDEETAESFTAAYAELLSAMEELEPKSDISLGEGLRSALEGEKLGKEERRYLDWMIATQVVEAAEEMERQSLLNSDDDDGFGGGDRLFPGGYHQIVAMVAEGLEPRLGHKVTKIEHGAAGVRVTTNAGVFTADACVVTVPLGVLKAGAIEFLPALPETKRAAIARIGMGVINKVVLRFPRQFWPQDPDFFGYVSNTAGEYPAILNLAKASGEPMLMLFTGGDFARSIETQSDQALQARAIEILRSIFGKEIPDPIGIKVARWGSDPFAGGSYTYVPVGATNQDFTILGEPVGERLCFAGEHTTPAYRGTVHGAFLSGVREAERLLK